MSEPASSSRSLRSLFPIGLIMIVAHAAWLLWGLTSGESVRPVTAFGAVLSFSSAVLLTVQAWMARRG